MIRILDKSRCCGCTACYAVCPHGAITMKADKLGFKYPETDTVACVDCGLCERTCPYNAVPYSDIAPLKLYAARNRDEGVRMGSSSGAVFPVIASNMLAQGGLVYGAAFTDDDSCEVTHICASSGKEVKRIYGSKYTQSDMRDCFREIRSQLKQGRKLLFSGTPCQVAGLHSYIGNDDNLYTMACACHGVPSPKVWSMYSKEVKGNSSEVSFRDKSTGWKEYQISVGEYSSPAFRDPYMRAMLKGLTLRPSCKDCVFKAKACGSDILAGDWWGIGRLAPEMDDGKGTSAVLVNSHKGFELIEGEALELKEMPVLDDAGNGGFNHRSFKDYDAEAFAERLEKTDSVYALLKVMTEDSVMTKLIRRIKKYFGK